MANPLERLSGPPMDRNLDSGPPLWPLVLGYLGFVLLMVLLNWSCA